ncbi:MAG: tetratricopeptide repeat protein [Candidatus Hodarchaeales archaeon]
MILISFDFIRSLRKKPSEELLPYIEELKKSEEYIHNGDFNAALENLQKVSEFSIPDFKLKVKLQLAKILTLIYKRDLPTAEDELNKLLKQLETSDTKHTVLLFLTKAYLALVLVEKRDSESANPLITECNQLFKKSKFDSKNEKIDAEATLYSIKAKYYNLLGELDQTIANFEESISIYRILEHRFDLANNQKSVAIVYAQSGNVDQALEHLYESRVIFEELKDAANVFRVVNNIGLVTWQKGELDDALVVTKEALSLGKELGNKQFIGVINQNLGLIHRQKGELNTALPYLESSKMTFEELNIKPFLAQVLLNLGTVRSITGELEQALSDFNEGLSIQTELRNSTEIAHLYNNIGQVYQIKGDYDTALDYCLKCVNIFKELNNVAKIIETNLNVIQLAIFKGDFELAEKYLENTINLATDSPSKTDKLVHNLSKALVLKSAGRMVKSAEAQQIFSQISNDDIINSDYTVQSMLNLCELLVNEIKFFGKEEIIEELKTIVSNLLELAKNQNMSATLVESLILQSKLSLFELSPKNAQEILQEAQQIAEERGLENLAILASVEYDLLLDKIEAFDFSSDSKLSFAERFGLDELEDLIQRMINKNVALLPKELEEEPILLLVVTEAGIPIYSSKFLKESQFDDMLISGFLTAINSFIKEAFATTGAIERIKQKNYTLLFQLMDPLTFCYVIKGPSYLALKKMDKFMNALKASNLIWDEILESAETGKSLEDLQSMHDMTAQFFTPRQ